MGFIRNRFSRIGKHPPDRSRLHAANNLTSVTPERPFRKPSSVLKSPSFPFLSLHAYPNKPESSVGSTYVSRVGQQVLLHGTGLSPQPPLRPDPVDQVPHDDTLRLLPPPPPTLCSPAMSRLVSQSVFVILPTSDFSSCVRPGVADTLRRRSLLLTFTRSGLRRFLLEKVLKIR